MLTAANLLFCTAMLPGLVLTTRVYIDARRAVFADAALVKPAIVLLPSRKLKLWPWQCRLVQADRRDFARDDVDYRNPILYGRLDAPDALAGCRGTLSSSGPDRALLSGKFAGPSRSRPPRAN